VFHNKLTWKISGSKIISASYDKTYRGTSWWHLSALPTRLVRNLLESEHFQDQRDADITET